MRKGIFRFFIVITTFICLLLTGCFESYGDDISTVRQRAKAFNKTQSVALIDALQAKDTATVKGLFCPLSQQLADLDSQIEESFAFIDGNITAYNVKDDLGYEGWYTEYGHVLSYSCSGGINKIVTDTGKKYEISFNSYIVEGDTIKGMYAYTISEAYPEGYDFSYEIDRQTFSVGRVWYSPYDVPCAKLTAKLITAIGEKDVDYIKANVTKDVAETAGFAQSVENLVNFLSGTPLFTVREDGLYGEGEHDFNCRVSYTLKPNYNSPQTISTVVRVYSIETDTGEVYELDFYALLNYADQQFEGFEYIALTNTSTEEYKSITTPED